MKKPLVLILVALLSVVCTKKKEIPPKEAVDLVPTDGEISGWTRTGTMAVPQNFVELAALIDGPAQTFVNNGFVKAAFQSYAGPVGSGTDSLDLRIFDMADTANARKIYVAVTTGSEVPWTSGNPGVEARIEETLFDYKIDFWDGKFYVWLTIKDNSDPAKEVARMFGVNISQAIRDTTK
jgi:hypothetical protein